MKSLDIQTTGIKVIDPLAPYAAQRRGKAASADERPRRAAAQLVPRRRVEPVSARRAYLRKSWPASTSLAATHLAGFNGELMPFTLCTSPDAETDRLPTSSTCFNKVYLPKPRTAWTSQSSLPGIPKLARLGHAFVSNRGFKDSDRGDRMST